MPAYRYTAYDAAGKMVSGVVEASGEPGALSHWGGASSWWWTSPPKARKGMTLRSLPLDVHYLFCKSLLGGLPQEWPPRHRCLAPSGQAVPRPPAGPGLRKTSGRRPGGRRLSTAMEQLGIFRESSWAWWLRGNERVPSVILRRGADLVFAGTELRRKVKAPSPIPWSCSSSAWAWSPFSSPTWCPSSRGSLPNSGQVLPLPTRILLAVADGVTVAGLPLLGLGVLLFLWIRRRKKPLNLPGSAALRERIALSLVFAQVATLVEAGIPLVQALEMAALTGTNAGRP